MELYAKHRLRKDVRNFERRTQRAIEAWIRVVESENWQHIMDVRKSYPHADHAHGRTIFNINGNFYRLLTVIDYELQIVTYEALLTHVEYDRYQF